MFHMKYMGDANYKAYNNKNENLLLLVLLRWLFPIHPNLTANSWTVILAVNRRHVFTNFIKIQALEFLIAYSEHCAW